MAQTSRIRSRRLRILTVSEGGSTALIMVGPVRGPEHLALIHRLGFYHVPVSAIASSRTAVAFVAFYEGVSRFQGTTGVIREYAEILRVSRVLRRDLPDLTWPGRRGEDIPYYRFDLGPIRSLPRTITNPDHLRVVFRFPELQRFQQAATIRDLGAAQHRSARSAAPAQPEERAAGSFRPAARRSRQPD
jgi:hypothetical protein